MTGLDLHIPVLTTERLVLRAPRTEDFAAFRAFLASPRAASVGGPVTETRAVSRSFGNIAGLWVLRGVSLFVAEEKARPGTPVGAFGPYEPMTWPEMEFGWSVWDAAAEGKGYVTEAMRTLIPWTWARTGKATAVSFIDADNARSIRVAEALGAVRDRAAEAEVNAADGPFHDPGTPDAAPVTVWRHRRDRWEAAA